MTNVKTIVSTECEGQMWWYPHNEQKLELTRMFIKMHLAGE